MAYCGTVTLHDAEGRALHTRRYGTMPEGDERALREGLASDVLALVGAHLEPREFGRGAGAG
jgi:hypothetical protein